MRSAIVENGVVTNVIMGEIEGSIPCPEEVSVGWRYDGSAFTAPPQPDPEPEPPHVPRSTAMWRARAIAKVTPHGDGALFDAVVAAIDGMSDPLAQAAASEAWERGATFDLDGQLVPLLMSSLGMTEGDVVPLIEAAESLPA